MMKKLVVGICSFTLLFSLSLEGFSATKKKKKSTEPKQQQSIDQTSQAAKTTTQDAPPPVVAPAPNPVTWPEKFEAGWKKGLYFQSKDGKYSLKFRIKAQPQFYYLNNSDNKTNNPDSVSFRMRRLELSWEGTGFTKSLDYKVQIVPTASSLDQLLEDAWLDYRFYNPLRFQFGQYKVPYIRQQITSSGRLQLVDRSLASDTFRFSSNDVSSSTTCVVAGTTVLCPAGTAGSITTNTYTPRPYSFDLGLMIHGDAWDNKLEYYASVTNGAGYNRLEGNKNLLYLGRVVWNVVGQYGYQESDVDYSEHPSITLGASGGYLKQDFTLTHLTQAGVELGAKYRGFSFQGEGFFRNNNPKFRNDYNDVGYYAQAGYIFKKRFEIAGRVSQVFLGGQGSNNLPGALRNNKAEYTGGFSYYIFQHDLKLQADYSYLTTQSPLSSTVTSDSLNDHRLRVQMQAWF